MVRPEQRAWQPYPSLYRQVATVPCTIMCADAGVGTPVLVAAVRRGRTAVSFHPARPCVLATIGRVVLIRDLRGLLAASSCDREVGVRLYSPPCTFPPPNRSRSRTVRTPSICTSLLRRRCRVWTYDRARRGSMPWHARPPRPMPLSRPFCIVM